MGPAGWGPLNRSAGSDLAWLRVVYTLRVHNCALRTVCVGVRAAVGVGVGVWVWVCKGGGDLGGCRRRTADTTARLAWAAARPWSARSNRREAGSRPSISQPVFQECPK